MLLLININNLLYVKYIYIYIKNYYLHSTINMILEIFLFYIICYSKNFNIILIVIFYIYSYNYLIYLIFNIVETKIIK